MVSKVAGKLVGAGIVLVFMGVGVLAYAETANNGWHYAWQELGNQQAPFDIMDPTYGWMLIGLGFALFGVAYLFR